MNASSRHWSLALGLCLLALVGIGLFLEYRRRTWSDWAGREGRVYVDEREDVWAILRPVLDHTVYRGAVVSRSAVPISAWIWLDQGASMEVVEASVAERLPMASSEVIADFVARSGERTVFPVEGADLSPGLLLVDGRDLEDLWERSMRSYWRSIRTDYGVGAVVGLSAPGISSDGLEALVYVEYSGGMLCGEGNFLHLRWEHGKWRIVGEAVVWIS